MHSKFKFFFLTIFEFFLFIFFLLIYLLIFFFIKPTKNKLSVFFIFNNYKKIHKYKINGDDTLLLNSFTDFGYKNYLTYLLFDNKKLNIIANIFCIIEVIKKRPNYICFRSDYHKSNSYLLLSTLFIFVKILKIKLIPISNDSCWLINIYRIKVIKKYLSEIFYIEDRNLFIKNDIKKRIIPTNINLFMFNEEINNKLYNISFIGRTKNIEERSKFIFKLKSKVDLNIFDSSNKFLSQEEYYSILSKSKYIINFIRSPNNKIHFTCRSLQAIALGCIVLEPKHSYLGKDLLVKNLDYLEYSSINSLLEVINLNEENNLINVIDLRKKLKNLYIENNIWKNCFNN